MSRRVAALPALEMIQALSSDSSDGEFLDNEEYEAVNAAEAVAELEAKSSASECEETVSVLPRLFGSKDNMRQSHDENQSADSSDADAPQPIRNKDGSLWRLASHLNVCKVACNSKI